MNINTSLKRIYSASECETAFECDFALDQLCELESQAKALGKPTAAIKQRKHAVAYRWLQLSGGIV